MLYYHHSESPSYHSTSVDPLERVVRLASSNAVVIFSLISCCMCHAVKRLFCGMGVNPTVYELDQDPWGKEIEKAFTGLIGGGSTVPVAFVGRKLIGAMDRVMASHINENLVPHLKAAGALLCCFNSIPKGKNTYIPNDDHETLLSSVRKLIEDLVQIKETLSDIYSDL